MEPIETVEPRTRDEELVAFLLEHRLPTALANDPAFYVRHGKLRADQWCVYAMRRVDATKLPLKTTCLPSIEERDKERGAFALVQRYTENRALAVAAIIMDDDPNLTVWACCEPPLNSATIQTESGIVVHWHGPVRAYRLVLRDRHTGEELPEGRALIEPGCEDAHRVQLTRRYAKRLAREHAKGGLEAGVFCTVEAILRRPEQDVHDDPTFLVVKAGRPPTPGPDSFHVIPPHHLLTRYPPPGQRR